jgi:catechol 2,3-dioxygenase-like lactoylglutathione lyase family enzyme
MKHVTAIIAALAIAGASASQAEPSAPIGIIGVKILVKDSQRAIDFYSKLGLKVGVRYNETEQEMLGEQGLRLILVKEASSKLIPGNSSLMVSVPDAAAVAKALRDAGFPDIGEARVTPRASVLIAKDPDGDVVEILSAPPK